ncbi:hypothetical protein [Cohnella hashimotonis]|uniref:Uncharacterized protein n=1 Tax=Cohnella hashimotonis TaxID=2826895 RepID=A0ABT6TDT1_9BACL|nr:hypothetical protein [Cohnella hashimotonis]MDI4644973.1 hypothetical protein [Cohnella hashimotonis]
MKRLGDRERTNPALGALERQIAALLSSLARDNMALAHLLNSQGELADLATSAFAANRTDTVISEDRLLEVRHSVLGTVQETVSKEVLHLMKYDQILERYAGGIPGPRWIGIHDRRGSACHFPISPTSRRPPRSPARKRSACCWPPLPMKSLA